VVTSRPGSVTLGERAPPRYPLDRDWVGPRSGPDSVAPAQVQRYKRKQLVWLGNAALQTERKKSSGKTQERWLQRIEETCNWAVTQQIT
jgi:hypothetical protein